jgi:hypothetical protein
VASQNQDIDAARALERRRRDKVEWNEGNAAVLEVRMQRCRSVQGLKDDFLEDRRRVSLRRTEGSGDREGGEAVVRPKLLFEL